MEAVQNVQKVQAVQDVRKRESRGECTSAVNAFKNLLSFKTF
jgi:hypothetical protein